MEKTPKSQKGELTMLTEKDFTKEQLAAGKALAYIERVICFDDMCYSLETSINEITDITECDEIPDYNSAVMSTEEGEHILALAYAKAISIDTGYVIGCAGYFLENNDDAFCNAMLYEDSDVPTETKLYKSLQEIRMLVHDQSEHLLELTDNLLLRIEHMPLMRMKFIHRAMQDYMFHVDEELFGVQSNDFGTIVKCVDRYDLDEFHGYVMKAGIYQNLTDGTNNLPILILFSCDEEDESLIHVDFKLERLRYAVSMKKPINVIVHAGTAGTFTSFDFKMHCAKHSTPCNDTCVCNTDAPAFQSRICNILERCERKLLELKEKDPAVNRILECNDPIRDFTEEISFE